MLLEYSYVEFLFYSSQSSFPGKRFVYHSTCATVKLTHILLFLYCFQAEVAREEAIQMTSLQQVYAAQQDNSVDKVRIISFKS